MQLSSHNFVDFCLQTTPTSERYCEVPQRIDLCHPDPYAGCWSGRDVDQSPVSVADVEFCDPQQPWWRPHRSSRDFTLTGTNFMSVPSHFARIKSSRSQYFSSTNHLSCGFYHNFFFWRLASKASKFSNISTDWFNCRDVTRHGLVVMHVVSRFLRIFVRAEKQACK